MIVNREYELKNNEKEDNEYYQLKLNSVFLEELENAQNNSLRLQMKNNSGVLSFCRKNGTSSSLQINMSSVADQDNLLFRCFAVNNDSNCISRRGPIRNKLTAFNLEKSLPKPRRAEEMPSTNSSKQRGASATAPLTSHPLRHPSSQPATKLHGSRKRIRIYLMHFLACGINREDQIVAQLDRHNFDIKHKRDDIRRLLAEVSRQNKEGELALRRKYFQEVDPGWPQFNENQRKIATRARSLALSPVAVVGGRNTGGDGGGAHATGTASGGADGVGGGLNTAHPQQHTPGATQPPKPHTWRSKRPSHASSDADADRAQPANSQRRSYAPHSVHKKLSVIAMHEKGITHDVIAASMHVPMDLVRQWVADKTSIRKRHAARTGEGADKCAGSPPLPPPRQQDSSTAVKPAAATGVSPPKQARLDAPALAGTGRKGLPGRSGDGPAAAATRACSSSLGRSLLQSSSSSSAATVTTTTTTTTAATAVPSSSSKTTCNPTTGGTTTSTSATVTKSVPPRPPNPPLQPSHHSTGKVSQPSASSRDVTPSSSGNSQDEVKRSHALSEMRRTFSEAKPYASADIGATQRLKAGANSSNHKAPRQPTIVESNRAPSIGADIGDTFERYRGLVAEIFAVQNRFDLCRTQIMSAPSHYKREHVGELESCVNAMRASHFQKMVSEAKLLKQKLDHHVECAQHAS